MLFDILKAKSNILTDDLFSDLWKKKKGGSPEVDIVSWADGTSAQIKAMLDAEKAGLINTADYWNVGDKRVFQLSAIESYYVNGINIIASQPAQEVEIALAHKGSDSLPYTYNSKVMAFDDRENVNLNNVTITEESEYIEIANSGGSAWYSRMATMQFTGLTVGKEYTIIIVPYDTDLTDSSGGYWAFYDANDQRLARMQVYGNTLTATFTATTPTIKADVYPCDSYTDSIGLTKCRFISMEITEDAPVSWITTFVNCLANQGTMNSTNTNAGSWGASAIRTYLNDFVFPAMSAEDRAIFTQFKTITANPYNGTVLETSNDYLALCAEKEIFGQATYSNVTEANALTQFDYYKTAESHTKTANGNLCYWWQRSPCKDYDSAFCLANIGNASFNPAGDKQGISPIGCI